MKKVREMQGVPAHLVTLRANDKRRHPARCKFHTGKGKQRICKCKICPLYLLPCTSAAKCGYYDE